MPPKLQEITVVFLREQFRRESFAIGIVKPAENHQIDPNGPNGQPLPAQFGILGDSEPDEFKQSMEYRLYGSWDKPSESSEKYGPQFRFKTFVRSMPHGRAGVIRYLSECRHIGRTTAQKLWDKFQSDAVRILREQPEVAAAAIGSRFTIEHASEAAEDLKRWQALENVTIQLTDLIDGRGFPKNCIREAIRMWGNKAVELLRRDPYRAMAFRGVGFKKADAMYLDLGLPPAKLKRQAYCMSYEVLRQSESQGHVWIPLAQAQQQLTASVGGSEVTPDKATTLAVRGRIMRLRDDGQGVVWAADARRASAEDYCCQAIAKAFEENQEFGVQWPVIDGKSFESLTDHQREQIEKALAGPIAILTGSPGTGKTYLAARLIDAIISKHGRESIAICAPTGKAAVRCKEALAQNGITAVEPKTIHRTLGVESGGDGSGWSFRHREGNPLPFMFLVIDEFSMCSTSLLKAILAARGRGTGVLLVGDHNQLPPVEYGAPLRDLIAAGLPCGELKEIHRNAGTIVRACASIRDGQPFEVDATIDLSVVPPKNLHLIPAGRSVAAMKLLGLVRELRGSPFDVVWDVQIIVAVNKRSNLSRRELNKQLQLELNPGGKAVAASPFREQDKVICLKNSFLKPVVTKDAKDGKDTKDKPQPEDVFVANGEIGRVVEVGEKKTIVQFSNPDRVVLIPRGGGKAAETDSSDSNSSESDDASRENGCDLDLAYAISCHKSQGSGFPVVIVVLDEYPGASGPYGVCGREWLFTGISRAEKVCFLVGLRETAERICQRRHIHRRKTFMTQLIHEYADKFNLRCFKKAQEAEALEIW